MSQMLFDQGIFAQSIQYPFVAKNQALIRVILSALQEKRDLDDALEAFIKVKSELGIIKIS